MPQHPGRIRRFLGAANPVENVEQRAAETTTTTVLSGGRWRMPSWGDETLMDLTADGIDRLSSTAVASRAINTIVSMLADRLLDVVDKDGKSLANAPIRDLWNISWNNGVAAVVNRRQFWLRMTYHGQAHVRIGRGSTALGVPDSLHLAMGGVKRLTLPPSDAYPNGELVGWMIEDAAGKWKRYEASEVLWARYPHATDFWGAVSPVEAAAVDLNIQRMAREWQASEFKGGSAKKVLAIEGASVEATDAFRAEVEALTEGTRNAGRVAVAGLPTGKALTGIDLSRGAEDLAYIEGVNLTNDQILNAFETPKAAFGGDGITYENQSAAKASMWTMNLIPKLGMVASALDLIFYPGTDATVVFPTGDIPELADDQDKIIQRLQKAAYADLMTMNEIRVAQGLEPLDKYGDMTRTEYNAWQQESLYQSRLEKQAALGLGSGGERMQVEQVLNRVDQEDAPDDGASAALASEAWRQWGTEPPALALPAAPQQRAKKAGPAVPAKTISRDIESGVKIGTKAVASLFARQEKDVLNRLKRRAKRTDEQGVVHVRVDESDPLAGVWFPDDQVEETERAIMAWAEAAAVGGLGRMVDALEAAGVDLGDTFRPGETPEAVLKAIEDRVHEAAVSMTKTTGDALAATLVEGVKAGEGSDELGRRVKALFTTMKDSRAEMVARDNVLGAYHSAQHFAVAESGIDVDTVERVWQCAGDDRVRASHLALDGTRIKGMKDRYPGGYAYPGDRSGDDSYGCRCVEEFHLPEGEA